MKLLLIALLLAGTPALTQRSIVFSWQQGVSPGWAPCSSGPYCLSGYTLYEITTGIPVVVAQIAQTETSYTMTPLPSKGSHSYELAQEGINGSGATVQSTANPGLVVNCWKVLLWRNCKSGKSWQ